MNQYDEIKKLISKSKLMLRPESELNEEFDEIRKKYTLLTEQGSESRLDLAGDIEDNIEDDFDNDEEDPDDIKQSYRISNGILTIHGKDKKDLEITTDDKTAFQETMSEFVDTVSDLSEFEPLNIYNNDVQWGGKIIDLDIEFFFSIGENNGIYINSTMTKIDENYLEVLEKLKVYYEKFKSKWAKVLSSRRKTFKKD
jgi:hypothetical protein